VRLENLRLKLTAVAIHEADTHADLFFELAGGFLDGRQDAGGTIDDQLAATDTGRKRIPRQQGDKYAHHRQRHHQQRRRPALSISFSHKSSLIHSTHSV